MPSVKVCVGGLGGAADESRLEQALCQISGVYGAVANYHEACVTVDYEDDEVALDALLDAVRAEGFGAELGG